ncbi:ABC transporter ATP-binding protein [Flavobacterium columnare NBRC 100251 = ATCC 23463]|uniref:ABC transporter ATP-binding protein n=1 Tax=Flavobacterium covae TaxID=2906076 RepID=A0ABW8PE58_9FLAO|nr:MULTISPECIES: ABC transporter ATP-binding protein [Flavobacterium]MBF6652181.1 ABC transporter ATP-binding protein [Flavobacterium columnare]MBF6655107.1 ABC transporter ATP-binding protein [Flavobacterium columnare]MBF6657767.1 ABC transporter ATP-binding protein [Flavobacterium columnare]MCJ1805794.1 ABC transporter ATP-binding protein [Flavobacterium covae]OWP82026.1 copper ABC transporter ATP-binding protein [Flavobacterium covae]
MIVIDNCNKKFEKLNVLKNVSITLESGQCVALIGPNGCGKTTLIKSILGMVIPDSGAIFVKNQSIQKDFLYRNNIGYMPQIGRYPEGLTIGEVIEMIKELRNSKDKLDEELLHSFEVQKMFDKPMGTLSGGTTQKVSAVLAFLFNPDILILDEPTAGLDPLAAEILKTKINKEKAKGKLIMITSHLLSELDDLITHIIFMQEGEIQFYKTINELKSQTAEEKISKAIAKILKQKLFTN